MKGTENETVCDPQRQCDPTDEAVGCDACENLREQGWRAALEHILKGCVLPNGMVSHSLIENELEEK